MFLVFILPFIIADILKNDLDVSSVIATFKNCKMLFLVHTIYPS